MATAFAELSLARQGSSREHLVPLTVLAQNKLLGAAGNISILLRSVSASKGTDSFNSHTNNDASGGVDDNDNVDVDVDVDEKQKNENLDYSAIAGLARSLLWSLHRCLRIIDIRDSLDGLPLNYDDINIEEPLTNHKWGLYMDRGIIVKIVITAWVALVLNASKNKDLKDLSWLVSTCDNLFDSLLLIHESHFVKSYLEISKLKKSENSNNNNKPLDKNGPFTPLPSSLESSFSNSNQRSMNSNNWNSSTMTTDVASKISSYVNSPTIAIEKPPLSPDYFSNIQINNDPNNIPIQNLKDTPIQSYTADNFESYLENINYSDYHNYKQNLSRNFKQPQSNNINTNKHLKRDNNTDYNTYSKGYWKEMADDLKPIPPSKMSIEIMKKISILSNYLNNNPDKFYNSDLYWPINQIISSDEYNELIENSFAYNTDISEEEMSKLDINPSSFFPISLTSSFELSKVIDQLFINYERKQIKLLKLDVAKKRYKLAKKLNKKSFNIRAKIQDTDSLTINKYPRHRSLSHSDEELKYSIHPDGNIAVLPDNIGKSNNITQYDNSTNDTYKEFLTLGKEYYYYCYDPDNIDDLCEDILNASNVINNNNIQNNKDIDSDRDSLYFDTYLANQDIENTIRDNESIYSGIDEDDFHDKDLFITPQEILETMARNFVIALAIDYIFQTFNAFLTTLRDGETSSLDEAYTYILNNIYNDLSEEYENNCEKVRKEFSNGGIHFSKLHKYLESKEYKKLWKLLCDLSSPKTFLKSHVFENMNTEIKKVSDNETKIYLKSHSSVLRKVLQTRNADPESLIQDSIPTCIKLLLNSGKGYVDIDDSLKIDKQKLTSILSSRNLICINSSDPDNIAVVSSNNNIIEIEAGPLKDSNINSNEKINYNGNNNDNNDIPDNENGAFSCSSDEEEEEKINSNIKNQKHISYRLIQKVAKDNLTQMRRDSSISSSLSIDKLKESKGLSPAVQASLNVLTKKYRSKFKREISNDNNSNNNITLNRPSNSKRDTSSTSSSSSLKYFISGVSAHPTLNHYIAAINSKKVHHESVFSAFSSSSNDNINDPKINLYQFGIDNELLSYYGAEESILKVRFDLYGNIICGIDSIGNLLIWNFDSNPASIYPFYKVGKCHEQCTDFCFIGGSSTLIATCGLVTKPYYHGRTHIDKSYVSDPQKNYEKLLSITKLVDSSSSSNERSWTPLEREIYADRGWSSQHGSHTSVVQKEFNKDSVLESYMGGHTSSVTHGINKRSNSLIPSILADNNLSSLDFECNNECKPYELSIADNSSNVYKYRRRVALGIQSVPILYSSTYNTNKRLQRFDGQQISSTSSSSKLMGGSNNTIYHPYVEYGPEGHSTRKPLILTANSIYNGDNMGIGPIEKYRQSIIRNNGNNSLSISGLHTDIKHFNKISTAIPTTTLNLSAYPSTLTEAASAAAQAAVSVTKKMASQMHLQGAGELLSEVGNSLRNTGRNTSINNSNNTSNNMNGNKNGGNNLNFNSSSNSILPLSQRHVAIWDTLIPARCGPCQTYGLTEQFGESKGCYMVESSETNPNLLYALGEGPLSSKDDPVKGFPGSVIYVFDIRQEQVLDRIII